MQRGTTDFVHIIEFWTEEEYIENNEWTEKFIEQLHNQITKNVYLHAAILPRGPQYVRGMFE